MGREVQKRLTVALCALLAAMPLLSGQSKEQSDSLVHFVKGSSIQLIEKYDRTYRKAVDATFLHNGTYLICDTALWDVDQKIINAEGHVQIIQDETVLTSERLDYLIDEDLAQFRGTLVQLKDKQNNTLRTKHLDYNTRDSSAVFRHGGSMRDKDGQIIESSEGTYSSKEKRFVFSRNVNMFTDSIFVRTDKLEYDTDNSKADFKTAIDFWKDGNMMSADKGWYDRQRETFFFRGKVHAMTRDQETWSDSLYYYRNSNNVLLLGNAQVQDTTRNIAALADYIYYEDSLATVTLKRQAAVAMRTTEKVRTSDGIEKEKRDTIYFGADTLIYYTLRKCDIPEGFFSAAAARLEEMFVDPVQEYRAKAAQAAAEAAAAAEREAAENDPNYRGAKQAKKASEADKGSTKPEPEAEPEPADTLKPDPAADSLALKDAADSLALKAAEDSLAMLPPDTTRVGFMRAIHNIRIFRKDVQVKADSMLYCDLDSIARFYLDPVVWNEGNRQYSSDSLFVLVRNNAMDRASLMSEAFILTREDSLCFDQIKATEVMAYFDTSAALRRFDALGGATAYFYLEENDALATMNKVESKMLSANFVGGDLDRIFYFDSPKNDAYPVAQLRMEDQRLRGFNWRDELRPKSRADITSLELKPSERLQYEMHPKASFNQTNIYFPGYIAGVYKGIEQRDSLKAARSREEAAVSGQPASSVAPVDPETPAAPVQDAGTPKDTLKPELPTVTDSLAVRDTTLASADSLAEKAPVVEKQLTPAQLKRKEREEAREARWAALDARDAAKAEKKAQKALAKKRERTRKALIAKQKQEARDAARLERYKARYAARKAKKDKEHNNTPIEDGKTD